jgi:hypothetical protein
MTRVVHGTAGSRAGDPWHAPASFRSSWLPAARPGLLGTTFLVVATVLDGAYVLLAGRLRPWLRDRGRARLRNRLSGSCLIAAAPGLALGAAHESASFPKRCPTCAWFKRSLS